MVQKVLFVCLGNICRSPIAHAVFQNLVKQQEITDRWLVDSAATGNWNIGEPPDSRASNILKKHNIEYSRVARQIKVTDFNEFNYIFGMDEKNISSLKEQLSAGNKAKILLLGDFDPQGERIIRDPYFDCGSEGFEKCYQQCLRSCRAFLEIYN